MKGFLTSTAFKLLISILIGVVVGYGVMLLSGSLLDIALQVLIILKHISGQIIFFMVPLIILGCVAPSITRFSGNVTKLLFFTFGLAYLSSIGAAGLSIGVSQSLVPYLHVAGGQSADRELPEMLIALNFPSVDTMSTLLFAMLLGLGTVWTKFTQMARFLDGFQAMVLKIVRKVMLPLLPIFVGSNFALLAYRGQIHQMKIFLPIIIMIVSCQMLWLVIMYIIATFYSKRNGWQVAKYYPKAYFTSLGTMSSAATLPVALDCISESPIIKKDTADFALPMFSNIHLCGSVIAEMFLVTATYYMLSGTLPPVANMAIFAVIACVIAIGSPGVPGGLNISCMTLVCSLILSTNTAIVSDEFFGIITAIYTIQDGFGTACNVTCDGALTLIVDKKLSKDRS